MIFPGLENDFVIFQISLIYPWHWKPNSWELLHIYLTISKAPYPAPSMGNISSVHNASLPILFRKSLRAIRASASACPPAIAATSEPLAPANCRITKWNNLTLMRAHLPVFGILIWHWPMWPVSLNNMIFDLEPRDLWPPDYMSNTLCRIHENHFWHVDLDLYVWPRYHHCSSPYQIWWP